MYMKCRFILVAALATAFSANAQYEWQNGADAGKLDLAHNLTYRLEAQASASDGRTPLWLNANKYGLSSLDESNGYGRVAVVRPLQTDSARRWAVGYGVDVAMAYNYTSTVVVQQAFAEVRWLHGVLSVGSKNYPMELKNNQLSSGSQTLGINARPVPQVRLALPEYWILPFGNGMIRMKGHVAFGKMTDDNWQHSFTDRKSKWADDVLYHSKAGYIMIGNPDRHFPLSLELGLEMAAEFGGTTYRAGADGPVVVSKNETGLKAFWNAFISGGCEVNEKQSIYQNVEGNQVGSWLVRANYDNEAFRLSLYADKYFDDHSSMFQLDYDGFGSGDEWNTRKKSRYVFYDFKDWMLGAELNLKNGTWLRGVVLEYLYTKYQSGPIYHDHTPSIPDHVCGRDNFYNHGIYMGWQHWGQVMGNPLYLSPIYNENGVINVNNNRFMAFHLGLSGAPTDNLQYRVLATYQDGLGTYANPYTHVRHNVSLLAEATYSFTGKTMKGWSVSGAYGMDKGSIRGHNYGFQLTISKTGLLKK